MLQPLQVEDLSVRLLRVGGISEGFVYLFKSTYSTCFLIFRLPNLAIRTLPHLLDDLEAPQNLPVDRVVHLLFHARNKIIIIRPI